MPTSTGKSPLCAFLSEILDKVYRELARDDDAATWMVYDASFEKMDALMAANGNRILGLYDELSTFLTQIKGKGINESHDLSTFLSLYNGKSWKRDTGTCEVLNMIVRSTCRCICMHTEKTMSTVMHPLI